MVHNHCYVVWSRDASSTLMAEGGGRAWPTGQKACAANGAASEGHGTEALKDAWLGNPHRLSALEARHVHGGVLRRPWGPCALDGGHAGAGAPVTEGGCRLDTNRPSISRSLAYDFELS